VRALHEARANDPTVSSMMDMGLSFAEIVVRLSQEKRFAQSQLVEALNMRPHVIQMCQDCPHKSALGGDCR